MPTSFQYTRAMRPLNQMQWTENTSRAPFVSVSTSTV